jgi:thiosulfate reductase / polysulfide reductase chain A
MASRRDFIKISALGLGGFVLAGGTSKVLMDVLPDNFADKLTPDLSRTPTYCEVCFWKCAGWVHKDSQGKIWKVTGNDDDPCCNGRFCPRGTGGVGMYYDQDRLKTPLIRTGERGKQTFREASWDEAFDYIAEKLKAITKEHGPECTALFTHGSGEIILEHCCRQWVPTQSQRPPTLSAEVPGRWHSSPPMDVGLESPEITDIRDTKCLVLIGSHLGENMHNGQVQEMSDAIDKGPPSLQLIRGFQLLPANQNTGFQSNRQQIWPSCLPGSM